MDGCIPQRGQHRQDRGYLAHSGQPCGLKSQKVFMPRAMPSERTVPICEPCALRIGMQEPIGSPFGGHRAGIREICKRQSDCWEIEEGLFAGAPQAAAQSDSVLHVPGDRNRDNECGLHWSGGAGTD